MENLEKALIEIADNNKILLSLITLILFFAKLFNWSDEKTISIFKKKSLK